MFVSCSVLGPPWKGTVPPHLSAGRAVPGSHRPLSHHGAPLQALPLSSSPSSSLTLFGSAANMETISVAARPGRSTRPWRSPAQPLPDPCSLEPGPARLGKPWGSSSAVPSPFSCLQGDQRLLPHRHCHPQSLPEVPAGGCSLPQNTCHVPHCANITFPQHLLVPASWMCSKGVPAPRDMERQSCLEFPSSPADQSAPTELEQLVGRFQAVIVSELGCSLPKHWSF